MENDIPFFVINLAHDLERKQHTLKLSHELGLSFNFIDAVNGKNLSQIQIDQVYDESLSVSEFGRGLTLGELGCALSHLNIYKRMIDKNIEIAVILEDDIEISDNIHQILDAKTNYPEVWDILLLGYHSENKNETISTSSFRGKHKITPSHSTVRLVEIAFGTHGYIISLGGAKKLIKILNKIIKPIDHYTGTEFYVNMHALSSRVIRLNQPLKSLSNIEHERKLKALDSNNHVIHNPLFSLIKKCISKTKIIYWIRKLPVRMIPVKEYK
jgi:glycosyl transferase family 25